jgi:flavodoxin
MSGGKFMSKSLVLYFSVYGTAEKVAKEIAKQTGADIIEIKPAVPYDSNRDHYNGTCCTRQKGTR